MPCQVIIRTQYTRQSSRVDRRCVKKQATLRKLRSQFYSIRAWKNSNSVNDEQSLQHYSRKEYLFEFFFFFFFFGLYRSGYKTSNDANTPVLLYSCILTFLSPSERFRVLLFLTCLKKINSQNDFKLRLEETACRF